MALKKNLTSNNAAANSLTVTNKEIFSEYDINITIGSGDAAVTYDVGYPFAFNSVTGKHAPWTAPDPTVLVIFLGTTKATGGTFDITVNGKVTADIAFDATIIVVAAELKAIGYAVTVTLTETDAADDTYTITFDDQTEVAVLPTVVGDVADLTGDTASTSTTTAGTGTAGTNLIKGFINPNQAQTGISSGSVALVVLTGSDTTCTATETTAHGLTTGMSLTMSGATEAKLNVTATITVTTDFSYTYTVAAVSGGTTDSGAYTTTNDQMATMMVKGVIAASVPEALVATADVAALRVSLKAGLIADGLIVQGLVGRN